MLNFEKLREELEEFRNWKQNIYNYDPIEKWMIESLGVEKLKQKAGSARKYRHSALHGFFEDGQFAVHLDHKKRAQIKRINFRNILYKTLKQIIDCMELEAYGEKKD